MTPRPSFGIRLTAAIEIDCRTVLLDPFYATAGAAEASDDGRAVGVGEVAGYRCESRFGREGQSRRWRDTRSLPGSKELDSISSPGGHWSTRPMSRSIPHAYRKRVTDRQRLPHCSCAHAQRQHQDEPERSCDAAE